MLIGKRISDRYKVLNTIGGGGMSTVYLAHDMILDRDVAIKILRTDLSDEGEVYRRFQREALSATSLHHPNIVDIYDVGEDGNIHYLVMEYIEGQTLKQFIQESAPLSAFETVEIMLQLTSAISHAHVNQIIHRDIKPQNVLMDKLHRVKISDFGIAMALSETAITQTNSVLGTVHYLSPEQARGGTTTKKSDIYALGIVMFELLTGQLPFSGETAVAIALKHLQSEIPSVRKVRREIPQSIENIIMKATAKDPVHRYRNLEEMEVDLKTALSPEKMNEKPFVVPYDDDATKAMPIIKDPVVREERIIPPQSVAPKLETKKKKFKWIASGIGAFLIVILLILIVFPGLYKADQVKVPDVSEMEYEQAVEKLEKLGFTIGEKLEEPSVDIEEGFVTKTDPKAGKLEDEGTEISIYVSTGKETIQFPDYEGRDYEQVVSMLETQNFASIEIEEVYSEEQVGTIVSQQPSADEEIIPEDTDVVLRVSKGQQLIKVLDLTNYTEKALNDYANSTGFVIKVGKEEFSETVPAGSVISQSPEADETLAPGETITVIVSKGKEAKPTKTLIQTVSIPYDSQIEGVEQTVQIYIQDKSRSLNSVAETFTITEETKKRLQIVIEEGEIAVYRIVVDGVLVDEQTIFYNDLN